MIISLLYLLCMGTASFAHTNIQTNTQNANHLEEGVTQVSHYDKGFSPPFTIYLAKILKIALDKSIDEYGPYELAFYSKRLSTNRSKIEAERGELIDLLFATHWNGYYVNTKNMLPLHLPVLDGLLGLRSLITTQQMDTEFSNIQNEQEFKQHTVGQGANWEDVKILKANQIPVIESQNFDALFHMLVKKRFDYISLSQLEVQTALRERQAAFSNLMTNKSVSVFYPLPLYLFVNAKKPELAERLKRGFNIAMEDGTIEHLFDEHFGFIKNELENNIKRLVVLKNPMLNDDENNELTNLFLNKYQSFFSVMN